MANNRWPQETDFIYTINKDCACMTVSGRWDDYANAYKNAADVLVEKCKQNHSLLDSLICPIFFLFRHSLELVIKSVVKIGVNEGQIEKFPDNEHSLLKLWKQAKPVIDVGKDICNEYFPDREPITEKIIDNAEKLIDEIDHIDKNSIAFRYAYKKDKSSSLPDSLLHLDPVNLQDCFRKLSHLLWVISDCHLAMLQLELDIS